MEPDRRGAGAPTAESAVLADDAAPASWESWVAASETRNWCHADPLLDWLDLYGARHGFQRGDAALDLRTDFVAFASRKAREFQAAVVNHLAARFSLVRVASNPADARSLDAFRRTRTALREGVQLLADAVLWDPESRAYGIADLIVRTDVLWSLFPQAITEEEAWRPAPALPGASWHYRIVEIKFRTLHLLKDGHAGGEHLADAVQAWVYNEALGRLQGLAPAAAYLAGRRWAGRTGRGDSALQRLARVDRTGPKHGAGYRELALAASDWIRRVRREGAGWCVLPRPTLEELRPNLRNLEDHPWHAAKERIARQLEDLTMLPRVSPERRAHALSQGVDRWTDARCTPALLGLDTPTVGPLLEAVIAANRDDGPAVRPSRVRVAEDRWRRPAACEFFVDFETVNDLDDDFSRFPSVGGQPLVFMIGCGHLEEGRWRFRAFTAGSLDEAEEAVILEAWLAHMRAVCDARGIDLGSARLFHWSAAETQGLSQAYNSAAARHRRDWGPLPWVDLLAEVVRAQPVTVRGAFGFGLKAMARALHAQGLIRTAWREGPANGLGAMAGAWWCHREARRSGMPMHALDLMRDIERYNEVDCRVMAEILEYLRAGH